MSRNGDIRTWAEVYQKFEQRCAVKRVKPSSMFTYDRTMGRFVAWADQEKIAPADIELFDVEDYLGSLAQQNGEPYSAHSLRTYCKDLRTLLNYAHDRKIFADRIKVELPKTADDNVKALTDSELETVLAHFEGQAEANPSSIEGFRNAAIVYLLKDSGLRTSELVALNWEDISWDADRQLGTVQVTKQMNREREIVSPKNGKHRVTFFYADTYHWLSQLRITAGWSLHETGQTANLRAGVTNLKVREIQGVEIQKDDNLPWPSPEEYQWKSKHPVFWLSYGEPERMGHPGLGKVLRNAGKKLSIRLYPHLLRHTAGRLMTKNGVSPITIAQVLGHSDLGMVMRYSKLWSVDLADVMAEKMAGNGRA
ncbi:MAG: site-specific integrase [Chloroflexi bacterium]|nr:site-specific integrase [Chloroflexota bacterium]